LRFRVQGLGVGVKGLGFRDLGIRMQGLGFGIKGSGSRSRG
jgi:hypothetical protein